MKKFYAIAAAIGMTASAFAADTVYDLAPVSWTPADGSTFNFALGNEVAFGINLGEGIKPVDGAKGKLTCAETGYEADINVSWFAMLNTAIVPSIEPQPTADGTYVLTMPEGQWGDADFLAGNGGHANAAFTYTYTVTGLGSGVAKECEFVESFPESGTTLDGFDEGATIRIRTTDNSAVDYYTFWITDITNGEDNAEFERECYGNHNHDEDDIFYTFPTAQEFKSGHRYKVHVTLYASAYQGPTTPVAAEFDLYYNGSGAIYEYSPVKLVMQSPDPATYVVEDSNFTCTLIFNDWVEVNLEKSIYPLGGGAGRPLQEGAIRYNEDHTEVYFTFDPGHIANNQVWASLSIQDKQGRYLYWGDDIKENSMLSVEYASDLTTCVLNVTPGEGAVESLSEFVVTCDKYGGIINLSYNPVGTPCITDKVGNPIVNLDEPVKGEDESGLECFRFTLNEPITEPGVYVLNIPRGYFNIGEQFTTGINKATYIEYEVAIPVDDETVYDYIPSIEGSSVSASNMVLVWPGTDETSYNYEKVAECSISDADGNRLNGTLDIYFDMEAPLNYLGFDMSGYNLEAGKEYTLNIVKGTFGTPKWVNGDYIVGNANPELDVKFTTAGIISIKETLSGVENVNAGNAAVNNDVYNMRGVLILRDATDAQVKSLPAGLYIIGGRKIAVR